MNPSVPDVTTARSAYSATVILADGALAEVRSLRADDAFAVAGLHERASDESIYRRFFAMNRAVVARYVEHLCQPTSTARTLIARLDGAVIGIASAEPEGAEPPSAGRAEVALLVDESMHGRGIGTALLEQLARWLGPTGVTALTAEVLADNHPMLRVFLSAGFQVTSRHDHEVLSLAIDIRPTELSVSAADARERRSEQRSLAHLFEPATVAVVGVSRRRGGIGREVVENIIDGGYAGRLFAVGNADLSISGATTLPDLASLPELLDLVVIAVPAAQVTAAVTMAAERKARACVVLTSGLAETGASGTAVERGLVVIARDHGMRLVGPNCFGVISRLRGTDLNATFGGGLPPSGQLGVGSQSGGVGVAVLGAAAERSLGMACFVSLGNKADLSGNDLLAGWADDPDIGAAALYLESFGNPQKFARLARDFGHKKPLLAMFGGTSDAGIRGGASHTAASATPHRALRALFAAAGVIEVDGVADLVDTSALLLEQPLPHGSRLAVISNAGGLGVLAADAAQRIGLVVPELDAVTRTLLEQRVPGLAGSGNPVDLGAAASATAFRAGVQTLLASDAVDAVLVLAAGTAVTDLPAVVTAVDSVVTESAQQHVVQQRSVQQQVVQQQAAHKPCLSVVVGGDWPRTPGGTTRFASAEQACGALARAARYSAWLTRPVAAPYLETGSGRTVPELPDGWLDAGAAARLLTDAGVGCAPESVTADPTAAVEAARRLGFPVVAKVAAGDVVHKTEGALVRIGLFDEGAVEAAVLAIQTSVGEAAPVLIQKQLAGVEIAVGVVRDEHFGPLVMVASGGVRLELWADQVFLMPPFTELDVRDALASLRTWPLLLGFRGSAAVDVDGLVELVQHVGTLALATPELRELDLNPVIVSADGATCVDAKVLWRNGVS